MSFFDTADRGALTLLLSRQDPLDSCYLTPEGTVLYRVATQKTSAGRGRPDVQVTTVQRFRSRPVHERRSATSVGLGFGLTCNDAVRRRRTRRSRSSQTPSLATISEDTDVTHSSSSSGDEYTNTSTVASSGTPLVRDGRQDRGMSEEIVCVATIEKRPFSLAPVVLTLHGKEHIAAKYLRKEATFSRYALLLLLYSSISLMLFSYPLVQLASL